MWRSHLKNLLTVPISQSLWQLRGDLLELDVAPDALIWPVIDQFYALTGAIEDNFTLRQHEEIAELVEMIDIGGAPVQKLIEATVPTDKLWVALLNEGIGMGLTTMASRKFVKMAETAMVPVYRQAGWDLYMLLWELMGEVMAGRETAVRRKLIEQILNPVEEPTVNQTVKLVLIIRLYQALLLLHLKKLNLPTTQSA